MSETIDMGANEKNVEVLLDHLLESLNQFCDQHPEIAEIDVFMAAHNFHCVTVLSLERDMGLATEEQVFWRDMALETFKRAMETKPSFRKVK